MKEQEEIERLLKENKELKKKIKRVYLALLNPKPKAPHYRAQIQWTPKEEAIVKEEVKNHGSVARAYLAIKQRGVNRTISAVKQRWTAKLRNN